MADTGSGHNVVQSVFVQCGAAYRKDGPLEFRCVGETEFVTHMAALSAERYGTTIAGIVAAADLSSEQLDEVIEAHRAAEVSFLRHS